MSELFSSMTWPGLLGFVAFLVFLGYVIKLYLEYTEDI
jgi:hypothetical protein